LHNHELTRITQCALAILLSHFNTSQSSKANKCHAWSTFLLI